VSLELDVIAKQLDVARNQIQPNLAPACMNFRRSGDREPATRRQPAAQPAAAPGARGGAGFIRQLHVRGEHANLQYRLNGVQLPEGINVFGQTLETRLADSVALITGRIAGAIRLPHRRHHRYQTKDGTIEPGGSVSMYGGSHEWLQPSLEWGGRVGALDYFLTGEFLHNAIGIENPTSSYTRSMTAPTRAAALPTFRDLDPTTRLQRDPRHLHTQLQIPTSRAQSRGSV